MKLQFVSDQGDEFRVRGFSFGIADCIAEKSLQGIQIPSVPGYFDGVSDSTFDSAGGGLKCFGYLGIQYFCDGVDDVHIVYRNDDGLSQILVALDMGGDADLMDDSGDQGLDAGLVPPAGKRIPEALPSPDLLQPLYQGPHIAGLQHQITHPQPGGRPRHIFRYKARCGQSHRFPIHGRQGF